MPDTPSPVSEAWVALPGEEELRTQVRRFHYDFGFLPAMSRLIFAHPEIGEKMGELTSQIMFAPGHLDRSEREMVAAVASGAQDCFY